MSADGSDGGSLHRVDGRMGAALWLQVEMASKGCVAQLNGKLVLLFFLHKYPSWVCRALPVKPFPHCPQENIL